MRGRYIDSISSYCDRWCERCAFTDRCSSYAVKIAMEMCDGDAEAALELAVGAPPPATEAERKRREAFIESLGNLEPTQEELAQYKREEEEREERLDELPITTTADMVWLLAFRWLKDHAERVQKSGDQAVAEAIDIATWDCHFIHVKLQRALNGRDEAQHGQRPDDDPIQNDWNGSAKVALISIDRSIDAWDVIAEATADPDAAHVARELRNLQGEVESTFPDARKFCRPGFDAPPRKRRRRRRP